MAGSGFIHALRPIDVYDVWLHLGAGKWIVEHRTVPTTDVFSHTIYGKSWVPHEWLSEVLYYCIEGMGGLTGIRLLNAALFLSLLVVLALLTWKAYGGRTSFALIVLSFASYWAWPRFHWRPESFSIVLMAVFAGPVLLRRAADPPSRKAILALAGLTIVWTNLHGMAMAAVGLTALYVATVAVLVSCRRILPVTAGMPGRRELRRWLLLLAALICSCAAVPQFWTLPQRALQVVTSSRSVDFPIAEWSPLFPMFGAWIRQRFTLQAITSYRPGDFFRLLYLALLVGFPICGWKLISRDKLGELPGFVVSACCLVAPLYAVRFTWMLFVPAIFVGRVLFAEPKAGIGAAPAGLSRSARQLGKACLVGVTALAIAMLGWEGISGIKDSLERPLRPERYPVGIVRFIRDSGLTGNLFNPYHWGGYLIYAVHPQVRVFIDGRNNAYKHNDPEVFADYKVLEQAGLGWSDILSKRSIDIVILDWPSDEVFPPEIARIGRDFEGLVPVLLNREGVVLLRPPALGGRPARLERLKAYFQDIGISLDERKGISPESFLDHAAEQAVRFRMVHDDYPQDVTRIEREPDGEAARAASIRIADALALLGVSDRAEDLYLRVLAVDQHNADAIAGMSKVNYCRRRYLESLKWAENLIRLHPADSRGYAMRRHLWRNHGAIIRLAQERTLTSEPAR